MVLFHLNTQSAVKHACVTQILMLRIIFPGRMKGVYADLNPNPTEASADRQHCAAINKKIHPSQLWLLPKKACAPKTF